jgi:DNA-binding transcriptional LysR family regulator
MHHATLKINRRNSPQVIYLELKHLTAFIAVAEKKSFIGAAVQLHLSQPAISAQIQRLEEDVGVQLLDRNRRSVQLTKAGDSFLTGARATLARAEEAVESAQRVARMQAGNVRVGFPPSVLQEILPNILIEFHRQFPHARLNLTSLHTSMTVSALLCDSIDVGFVRLPVKVRELQVIPVHREPLLLCLPEDHPLAAQNEIDLLSLRDEKFIVYERKLAPGFHDALIGMFQRAGITPKISEEIDEMYVAPALVATGVGLAVLPQMVVSRHTQGVVLRYIRNNPITSQIGVAFRNGEDSPLVNCIISIARIIGKRLSIADAN